MSIPYIDYSSLKLITRKPKKEDKIILYNSNGISLHGDGDSEIVKYLKDNIVFIIQSNIITEDGIDKKFILVKAENPAEVVMPVNDDIILKVHVNNIRQILTEDNDGDFLDGDITPIRVGADINYLFSKELYPRYKLDDICEENDIKLLNIYSNNIKENYNVPELETELRIFQDMYEYGGINNTLNSHQFNKILSTLDKSGCFYNIDDKAKESLDILVSPSIPNLRFTIKGRENIIKYCSNNIIPKNKSVEAIFKSKYEYKSDDAELFGGDLENYYRNHYSRRTDRDFKEGVFNLYSLRTKLGGKLEIPLELDSSGKNWILNRDNISKLKNINSVLNMAERDIKRFNRLEKERGTKYLKIFRLKSRTSFMYNSVIKIDLTKVKSSKEEVFEQGRTIDINLSPKYNFIESDVVGQNEKYEVEIELINTINLTKDELAYNIHTALNIIKYMNCIVNERPGFTHTNLEDNVLFTYKKHIQDLLETRATYWASETGKSRFYKNRNPNYYISPKVKSLEIPEVQASVATNTKSSDKSIMTGYTVTEKADGLAQMLYVYSSKTYNKTNIEPSFPKNITAMPELDGYLFCIDSNMKIYNTYIKIPGAEQWRLDNNPGGKSSPRLAPTDVTNQFKVYLFNGEYLNYDKFGGHMNKFGIYDTYMYGYLDSWQNPLQLDNADYSDIEVPVSRVGKANRFVNKLKYSIQEPSAVNSLLKYDSPEIFCKKFYVADDTNTIFEQSDKIWSKKDSFEYKLDGLVYTPANEPVGYNPKNDDYMLVPYNTWDRNLKWKPPHENTIDFLIKFKKYKINSYNGTVIYKREIKGKSLSEDKYYVVEFYTKGKVNGEFKPVRFNPPGYDAEECEGLFKININDEIVDKEGNIVNDDTIVEVIYDPTKNFYERWGILRTRYDKTYQYKNLINYQKNVFKKIQKAKSIWNKARNNTERKFLEKVKNMHLTKRIKGKYIRINNIRDIDKYYIDYSDIQSNKYKYNFGNSDFVAKKIWESIHTPITDTAITTGKGLPLMEEMDTIYYSAPYESRSKSLTINLQNYHNRYIKGEKLLGHTANLIRDDRGVKADISLLDLACGKGGDMWKWNKYKINDCVGIDISEDNITNDDDGAWVRYKILKDKRNAPSIEFRVLNTSENVKSHFPELLPVERKFDIITLMFALHYFFKDEASLDGLIKNIVENIKEGGYFIGACFDGQLIYDKLDSTSSLEFSRGDQTLLKIDKLYPDDHTFMDDSSSLGLTISVNMYSIGTENEEYLVNFNYLTNKLAEFDISPIEIENFSNIDLPPAIKSHLNLKSLSPEEKEMSNLNNIFIFQKNKSTSK